MSNYLFAEENGLKVAFAPVDLNTAAVTGARVKLDTSYKVAVLIDMGTSIAAVVQVTLRQHNAASAGTSKDLASAKPYYHKAGAATSFTKVEPTVAAALKDVSSIFAANGGLLVLEVDASELDINNGFAWFSVDVADSTAAKLGGGVYILNDTKYEPAHLLAL